MILAEPLATFGQSTLLHREPDIHIFHDVLFDPGVGGAVFDRARRLIPTAAYMRGVPDMHFIRAPIFSGLDPDLIPEDPLQHTYLFAGELHDHYGHFVVNTLSRFWALKRLLGRNIKILFANGQLTSRSFRQAFHKDFFAALGVDSDDIVTINNPMRLRRLIVPEACFEENNVVYSAFSTMCREIGQTVCDFSKLIETNQPVYLTKHLLTTGSSRIVNEDKIINCLSKHGVKIISPESMNIREQIEIWHSHSIFAGWMNSAMHTSAFVQPKKLVILNYEQFIYSNQLLVDRVNGNKSCYLYPEHGIDRVDVNNRFSNNFCLSEPHKVGEEILRAIDGLATDSPGSGRLPLPLPRRDKSLRSVNLISPNLAAGKQATVSSTCEWSKHTDPEIEASGATSGFLTGSYQFHTALELQPWWSVDLENLHRVQIIRIYNRCDDTASRASKFELLSSLDNINWNSIYYTDSSIIYGGLHGAPFIWRPSHPIIARYIRIRLLERNFLHLDQIEILGEVLQ